MIICRSTDVYTSLVDPIKDAVSQQSVSVSAWKNIKGRLDLAVLFTPSTPNRQNKNQVRWNICAGVRRSTPSFEVVQTEQSRDLFQKRWRIIACMSGNILYRLIYSGVLQSAQFYLFMWLFWRTPSTLKIAKSSPPQIKHRDSSIPVTPIWVK